MRGTQTKIIATIGPSSQSVRTLTAMIRAGVTVARLNFSHGTHASHRKLARHVRQASRLAKRNVALLADLQGPKIRIGDMPQEGVFLKKNAEFIISTKKIMGSVEGAFTDYRFLPQDVKKGDKILLDDGLIRLEVKDTTDKKVSCKVS